MRNLTLVAVAMLLICASGCATVARGDKQKLKFVTVPPGATLQVGDQTYTTPATVPLKRKDEHQVTISKPGYQPISFVLKARWDGASLGGAAVPGGSLSVATDRASGADLAFYKLEPITLQPANGPTTQPLEMAHYRGKIYSQEQYEKVIRDEIEEALRRPAGEP